MKGVEPIHCCRLADFFDTSHTRQVKQFGEQNCEIWQRILTRFTVSTRGELDGRSGPQRRQRRRVHRPLTSKFRRHSLDSINFGARSIRQSLARPSDPASILVASAFSSRHSPTRPTLTSSPALHDCRLHTRPNTTAAPPHSHPSFFP